MAGSDLAYAKRPALICCLPRYPDPSRSLDSFDPFNFFNFFNFSISIFGDHLPKIQ
jgi:hypothetical protein